jgi:alkylmercury lyase-like protein
VTFEIRTAAELVDPELEARWTTRRAARETETLRAILRMFVERPDPIVVEEVIRAFPDRAPDETRAALTRLDEDDLIQIRDGRVDLAYPFSTTPMPFVVHLSGRGDRYVCCAIDALGVAPMLGEPIRIRSRCHHCGESLEFSVDPSGPGPSAEGIMMWAGKRCADERRASTST